jgi:hypothetical protein
MTRYSDRHENRLSALGGWGATKKGFANRGKTGDSATQPQGYLHHGKTATVLHHPKNTPQSRAIIAVPPMVDHQIPIAP